MIEKRFCEVSASQGNPKWEQANQREISLYQRKNEVRSEFLRDYTRVLHCSAFRRLKHKTQVFFSPQNDHICTRIEHVLHVESISATIAGALGLNEELTKAIAISHDLGHPPFGHGQLPPGLPMLLPFLSDIHWVLIPHFHIPLPVREVLTYPVSEYPHFL